MLTRRVYAIAGAMALVALSVGAATTAAAAASSAAHRHELSDTATPIKHLVVIFEENVSFDHYFGTYPYAENLPGEQPFSRSPRHSYRQWPL